MGKVLKEVAKLAGNLLRRLLKNSKNKDGESGKISVGFWIVAIIVIFLFLLMSVTEILLGSTVTFTEGVLSFFKEKEYTEEEMNYILSDAGELAEFMKRHRDFELTEENSFLLDRKTVIRILKAVDAYNDDVVKEYPFSYEYMIEEGPLSPVDPITGESEVIQRIVENEVNDVETSTEVTSHTVTASNSDVSMVIRLLERDGATGITVTPVSGSVLKVSYNKTTVTERETTRIERVTYETRRTFHNQDTYTKRMDIDTDMKGVGEDVFYLRWQPILALCNIYILDNYMNIGSYDEVDEDGASYYLSNDEIERIISVFRYEYSYYFDLCDDNTRSYDFDYIFEKSIGYRIAIYENGEGLSATRTVKRIPAIAPKKIENSYLTYEYNYEVLDNGFRRLKERTYTLYPQGFLDACEQLAPSFDGDLFVLLLECMPQAEDLAAYYKNKLLPLAEAGQLITETTDDILKCPSIGIIVSEVESRGGFAGLGGLGASDNIEWDAGAMEWTGEYYEVPLYAINGWGDRYVRPAEHITEEGNSYGTFKVYEDAMKSLTISDNFTLEEMEYLFFNGGFESKCPLFANDQAIRDTAKCFYDYQERTGTSVCGLLGMMKQEGGFYSAIARNGWNFFNIKAKNGQPVTSYTKSNGTVKVTDFRNYRADYEYAGAGTYGTPAVNALAFQMDWVNRNYWQRGQNSFYLMIWNGYNVQDPEHAYESISHSYCPPWDDQAMPYSRDSYVVKGGSKVYYWKNSNSDYEGWSNKCAKYRHYYYNLIKKSS